MKMSKLIDEVMHKDEDSSDKAETENE
jgi:hypothetical protein